jgi:lipoteichoic acid synthase
MTPNRSLAPAARPLTVWLLDASPLFVGLLLILAKFALLAGRVTEGQGLALLIALASSISALLASLLVMCSRPVRLAALLVVNVVVATAALADAVHVRVFGNAIALAEVAYAHQLLTVVSSVRRLLQPVDALYYVDVLMALVVTPLYIRACHHVPSLRPLQRVGVAAIFLLAGIVSGVPLAKTVGRDPTIYHAVRERFSLEPAPEAIGAPQREKILAILRERRARERGRSPLFGAARGKNLIVISAESLSAYPLGLVVEGQPIMPRFSAFARESLSFTSFYDQTASGGTSDGEFITLHSLHPVRSGAVAFLHPQTEFRGLPAILVARGYTTVSACGAAADFWNMQTTHRRLGFQKSHFADGFQITERINGWLADAPFFDQVVPRLARERAPFMAFLLSSSNHHPFALPASHRTLRLGSLEGTELGDYLHSVHYFDEAFGHFVDRLRATSLLDESVVVVYGDHKGYLADERKLATLLGLSSSRPEDMWLERKRVPLVVRLPHGAHAGQRSEAAGHLDIAPTLLSLLGIAEDGVMLGRDVTTPGDSLVVFRDGSFADGQHYLIRLGRRSSCFERKTGRAIGCDALEPKLARSQDQLLTSDFIIQGNLIPSLLTTLRDRL